MRKMPGPEASATAMKMLRVLGLTLSTPNGSALKTKVANSQAPARKVSASRDGELRRLRPVARDEQHAEEDDREGEEDAGQGIGDRRLENARRHQEVEQEDDREGQHQIGQERQHRVDAPAEIARRKPERDADRQRQQRRQRRDDEHDARAGDDAAEHVARQLVAAEEIGQPRVSGRSRPARRSSFRRSGRADRRARSCGRRPRRTARRGRGEGRRSPLRSAPPARKARACGDRRC